MVVVEEEQEVLVVVEKEEEVVVVVAVVGMVEKICARRRGSFKPLFETPHPLGLR